jgi:hypothetical protein
VLSDSFRLLVVGAACFEADVKGQPAAGAACSTAIRRQHHSRQSIQVMLPQPVVLPVQRYNCSSALALSSRLSGHAVLVFHVHNFACLHL